MAIKGGRGLAEALSASGVMPEKKAGRGKKTRKKALPEAREKDIQSQVMEWLALHKLLHWRNNTGAWKVGSRYVRFGVKGSGDIFVLAPNRFISIECKRPGEQPTDDQRVWMDDVRAAGHLGIVIRSIEDLQEAFEKEGVLS